MPGADPGTADPLRAGRNPAAERPIERLVLWDVDGTLVEAGAVSVEVIERSIALVAGRSPSEPILLGGKTDPQIVREYLGAMGADTDLMAAVLATLEREMSAARAELAARSHACPGAAEILQDLADDRRVAQSVLTGNIAPNAAVKLGAFGLTRHLDLEIGAFGSDAEDRRELVPVALGRLAHRDGIDLQGGDVWVIGDTPSDLAAARAGGARCLLVGSGRFPAAELATLGADAVLPDLSDTATVRAIVAGDLAGAARR